MNFFQILVVASPGPYAQTFFLIFEKNIFFLTFFYEYLSFSLPWESMGAKISKRYSFIQIAATGFQTLFWIFILMVLTKLLWGFLKF